MKGETFQLCWAEFYVKLRADNVIVCELCDNNGVWTYNGRAIAWLSDTSYWNPLRFLTLAWAMSGPLVVMYSIRKYRQRMQQILEENAK